MADFNTYRLIVFLVIILLFFSSCNHILLFDRFLKGRKMEESVTQMQPMHETQLANSEGGYVWQVTDMNRLHRFLCFGSEGGTYYIQEQRLGLQNAEALLRLIEDGRGCEVIQEIKSFSQEGRNAKQEPTLFALAICSQCSDTSTKQAAFKAVPEVCRIPTHLFTFIQFKKDLKESMHCGMWGRALRKAVADWYNEKGGMALALAVTKYKQRNGWSHKDLLRLSHLKPSSEGKCKVLLRGVGCTRAIASIHWVSVSWVILSGLAFPSPRPLID